MRDDALIRDLAAHLRELRCDEYEAIAPAISLPVEVIEATGVEAGELKRALLEMGEA